MNKDNIKGKAKDIAGRAQRQVGEWTGDKESQAEGMGKQVEGKVQKAWGDLKDAGRRAEEDIRGNKSDVQPGSDIERDRKDKDAA